MECRCDGMLRRQVNPNGLGFVPVRRDLQDRRPAQSTMSDQHLLAESMAVAGGDHLSRNAGQVAVMIAIRLAKHKRHEPGPRFLNLQSELPRQIVAERSSPYL